MSIEKSLENRTEADYKCFQILSKVFEAINYEPGLKKFKLIVNEFYADNEMGDWLVSEIEEAIDDRKNANESFLKSFLTNQQADSSKAIE